MYLGLSYCLPIAWPPRSWWLDGFASSWAVSFGLLGLRMAVSRTHRPGLSISVDVYGSRFLATE